MTTKTPPPLTPEAEAHRRDLRLRVLYELETDRFDWSRMRSLATVLSLAERENRRPGVADFSELIDRLRNATDTSRDLRELRRSAAAALRELWGSMQ